MDRFLRRADVRAAVAPTVVFAAEIVSGILQTVVFPQGVSEPIWGNPSTPTSASSLTGHACRAVSCSELSTFQ